MANYKLIASDLDGTLFNSKVEVSPQNQKAIKTLHENGVFFAPSSGRTLCEIPEELVNNPYIRFVIYSNGSSIYDKETGETLLLSKQKYQELVKSYLSYIKGADKGEF